MTARRILILSTPLALWACASTPPPAPPAAPENPIVVEAEQKPFEVRPYTPPPDAPPPETTAPAAAPKPEQTSSGTYRISIASLRTDAEAKLWAKRAESLGYRTDVEIASVDGVVWHRVVLPGYRNREDALAAIGFAAKDFGIEQPWRLPSDSAPSGTPVVLPPASAPAGSDFPPPPENTDN